jgi:hypothetical protein
MDEYNPNLAPAGDKENKKANNKRSSVERIYQKKTQLEHILLRPDTYIGSVQHSTEKMWVLDEETKKIVSREITYVPGFYKIFDEILVNAADNKQRDKKMDTIKIDIIPEENKIMIYNNGKGIPVQMHKDENMYVPTMIFGHLLTSSNFDDEEQKVTGGRNGFGAKLCNVFSTKFTVETHAPVQDSKLKQTVQTNEFQYPEIAYERIKRVEYPDGSEYEGQLKNKKRHGNGTMLYKDGTRYVGAFKLDKRCGQGILQSNETWFEGNSDLYMFKGEFKDDKMYSGKMNNIEIDGCRYSGDIKDGKRHGYGESIKLIEDGELYAYMGSFKNDKRDGFGRMIYKNDNGKRKYYEGFFKEDMRNGQGTMTFLDKSVYIGKWKNDLADGYGELIERENDLAEGKPLKGEWKQGVLVKEATDQIPIMM